MRLLCEMGGSQIITFSLLSWDCYFTYNPAGAWDYCHEIPVPRSLKQFYFFCLFRVIWVLDSRRDKILQPSNHSFSAQSPFLKWEKVLAHREESSFLFHSAQSWDHIFPWQAWDAGKLTNLYPTFIGTHDTFSNAFMWNSKIVFSFV